MCRFPYHSFFDFYFIDFNSYQNAIQQATVADIDVTSLSDGEYVGSYDAGYIYAKVKVEIKDGKITDIKLLKHDNERVIYNAMTNN